MNSRIWAVVALLVVIVGGSAIYYFAVYIPQKQAALAAVVQEKEQCATQGKQFVVGYVLNPLNVTADAYADSPIYHFNTKLNTCLVAMHYTWPDFDPNGYGLYTDDSLVVDVNSNQPILYSEFNVNPTASTTKIDVLPGNYTGPNLSTSDYQKQEAVLMSE